MGERIPFALCAYSLPHSMGYLATLSGESISHPLGIGGIIEMAATMGLAGVEAPLETRVPVFDGKTVDSAPFAGDIGALARSRGLRLIADYGALLDYGAEHTIAYLELAAAAGAQVVRCILSHILCGDRRRLEGGWQAHRTALAARLRQLLPRAEELGLSLAVENHQDATSDDLLRLYEESGSSPAFGVTLDTGNPLAVCEDPVEYADRISGLIRHIHMKDYTIHFAPEGFRLVRCAAGAGVVDFAGVLRAAKHELLPSIEIAAQATRTVPMLEESWWGCYPPEQAARLPAALRTLWRMGRPQDEPYSSCWERAGSSAEVAAEESLLVEQSVQYLRTLRS